MMVRTRRGGSLARLAPALLPLALLAACQAGAGGAGTRTGRTRTTTLVPQSVLVPAAVPHAPRPSPVDVLHYAIDLDLEPTTRSIEGECAVRFTPRAAELVRLRLDLAGLAVRGVRDASGRDLHFTHEGETLTIDLGRVLAPGDEGEVRVAYGGRPAKGLWFAGDRDGQPTHAFTQGECEDSRWWFPCWDAPGEFATSEVRVTLPPGWRSVAAGDLVERGKDGRKTVEHWRMERPHAPYLTTLVAGELVQRDATWDGVPLSYLAEPRYARWMDASFSETGDILAFLSELTGVRYPWSKYAQACVENFPFGGMENISATTLTSATLDDELGNRDDQSHDLVAHEAAHQWFGNLMTCADWSHVWLNESLATYAALLYFERTRGADELRVRMRDDQDEYAVADLAKRRAIVTNVYKDPIDLFDEHVYQGGAARLHLLRSVLGDEAFVEGLRAYVAQHQGQPVVTADLRRAFEGVSGESLGWFFEQWLERPGFPEIETSWRWNAEREMLTLSVTQTQSELGGVPRAFRFPVDVEIRDRGGSSLQRVWVDARRQSFDFPVKHEPQWVRFDKYGFVPKLHRAKKAPSEWIAIAKDDDDVNGRRDALAALGALAKETVDPALRELYRGEIADRLVKEKVPAARVAAVKAAEAAGGLEARTRLVEVAASDPDAQVREEALLALRAWCPDPELARFADEQLAARYSWDVMAAASGLRVAASPDDAYAHLTQALLEASPHDQLRARLLRHLGSLENAAASDQLRVWAADASTHDTARAVAVEELAKRSLSRTAVVEFLVGLLDTESFRLRQAVLKALSGSADPRARRALADRYRTTVFPREKRIIEASLSSGF